MKRYIYFLFFALCCSCTEIVEVELGAAGDPLLVVYGEITDIPRAHEIKLSLTAPYLSNEPTPVVSGAKLEIHWNDEFISLSEDPEKPGSYYTPNNFFISPLIEYTLVISEVDINGDGEMESYVAKDQCLPAMPVQAINPVYEIFDNGELMIVVGLFAQEPPETTNYFCFRSWIKHVSNGEIDNVTERLDEWFVTDDRYFSGMNFNGAPILIINEGNLTGINYSLDDSIILEVRSVSKNYYDFATAAQTAAGGSIPMFSGPAANVPTNLSEGAIGFFAVHTTSFGIGELKEKEED